MGYLLRVNNKWKKLYDIKYDIVCFFWGGRERGRNEIK